jgi:hypothetical protein
MLDDGLRLARPQGSDIASDDGRRTPPRPTPGLGHSLGLGRRTPPHLTPGLGLNLDAGRRTPPRPTLGLGLDLDLGRRTPPRPTPGVGLSLNLGRRTRPRPRRSLRLARPRARTDHVTGGAIITLPLASSGYEEQDRRPIWLAPVNK